MVVSVRPGVEILLFVGEVAEKRIHDEEKKEEHKRERSQLEFEILSKILRRCSRPVGLLVTVDKSSVTREKFNSCQICHKIAPKVKNPKLGL